MTRSPESIQREIEDARASLGRTLDSIVERTNPKNVAEKAKTSFIDFAKTARGQVILGGTAAAFVGLVVLNRLRNR